MRHGVYGRKLGRKTNHRIALWRNQAIALFTHNQITTTIPKAKALQPFVEKLITAAKKGDLASRRRVIAKLGGDPIMIRDEDDENVVRNKYGEVTGGMKISKHLFDEIAPQYADRDGGYTRIIKLGVSRIGDGSDLCVIQLVGTEEEGGPQVSGKNSRRREKSNKRMEFAAKLRKDESNSSETIAEEDAAAATVAETTTEAEPTEAPAAEAEKIADGDDTKKVD